MATRRDLDEDDVRVRATRSTRPRTRKRPEHASAEDATVVAVDRGRFSCHLDGRTVTAMRSSALRRDAVVVGDRVSLVGDVSDRPDALARIVRVAPRRTQLRRTADDTDPVERVVVANADQLVIVVALADPPPRARLIDRCLVAAFHGGLEPLLCLTKRDLASPDALLADYAALDVAAVSLSRDADLGPLSDRLVGRTSVLVGHSGVGKSTLVNRLVPDAGRATGGLTAHGRGRHVSSSAIALPLPQGGWIVDTPGIRSFGLGSVTADGLLAAFGDLAERAQACPAGCDHTGRSGRCALDAPAPPGPGLAPERIASFRRLLASRERDPAGNDRDVPDRSDDSSYSG